MELEILIPLIGIIGWCLGVSGFLKARRALTELAALREQLAGGVVAAAVPAPANPWARRPVETPAPEDALPVAEPEMPAAAEPPPPQPRRDIEALLTQRWGVWLGAAALLLAGVFLVRTAAEQGWLGPEVRCALAALLGGALIGSAEWLRRRPSPPHPAPAALAAGGVAALMAAAYATGVLYALVPPLAGFALMAAAGLAGLALSLLHGPVVAAVGLVGAYATPLLVDAGPPSLPGLFGYLLLVTAAALLIMRATAWTWLGWAACACAAAWVVLVALAGGTPDAWAPGLFVPATAALFLFLLPGAALDHPVGRRLSWVPVLVLAVAGLFLIGLTAAPGARAGVLLLAPVALAAAWREPRLDRVPWLAALASLLVLLTWALPAWQATGEDVTIDGAVAAVLPGAWAPEAIRSLLGTAAAVAALFAAAGLAGERRMARPLPWAGFAAAVPVLTLATTYAQVGRFQSDSAWAAIAALLAAGLVGAAALARRDGSVQRAGLHAAGAVAALALGCAMLLADQWLTLAVALFLPPLAWIEDRADLPPLRRVALAVAVVVLVRLALNPFAIGYAWGTTPVLNGLLLAYGVPAACFALAAWMFRRRGDDGAVAALEAGAWVLGTLLVVLEIRHWATRGDLAMEDGTYLEAGLYVSALGVLALAAQRLHARQGRPVLRAASEVLGVLALSGGWSLLVLNPLLLGGDVGPYPVLNALLPAYAVPAALALLGRRGGARGRVLAAYAGLAAFAWITLSVRHAFHPVRMAIWAEDVEDAELWAYSGAWLLLGAALMAWGMRTGRRPVRLAALALVGLSAAKVFLVDMSGLDGLWRVLSFLGLGLALIGLSAFYRRYVVVTPAAPPP